MRKMIKVPVIMQMEASECGAASLAMILAYYKKWVPLSVLREECGVSRDGSNAVSILKTARSYGFEAKGYRYTAEEVRENVKLPAIIHWNFNHFVVLDGFNSKGAVLNDPARGRVTVSMEEFKKSFTTIVLAFEPTADFAPGGRPASTLEFARTRLRGTAPAFAFVILTGVILQLVGVLNPLFSRVFMDNVLGQGRLDWLRPLLMVMGAVLAIQIVNQWISTVYMLKIRGKLAIVANTTFMWHVLRLPVGFFTQRYAGDISQRQNSNEKIAETLINQLAPTALNFVLIVFYLAMMLWYSPLLTAIGVGTVLLNILLSRYLSGRRVDIVRRQKRDMSNLASTTVSGIEMIETIKSAGAEDGYFETWAGYQAGASNASVDFARVNQFFGSLPNIILQIANGGILLLGAWLIIRGNITVGMLMAFQGFMGGFMKPANQMTGVMQSVQEMRSDMERIEDVLKYETDVPGGPTDLEADCTRIEGEVALNHVTFGYSRFYPPLIEDFSMQVRKGGKVAFVGFSGCGKSTLARLITNLYQPWSGSVTFDGRTIEEIGRPVFTASVSVVDQNIILFNDTVRENVRMWNTFVSDEEVIRALKDAQLYDDIMEKPGGLSCMVAEGGSNFSGGQRQRLEIARALAQNPAVIVLDEATSALDARTEAAVMAAIGARGVTCIVIAHRLSTIRDCDEIVVLNAGKVVERGTHEELYKKGGFYTDLIQSE